MAINLSTINQMTTGLKNSNSSTPMATDTATAKSADVMPVSVEESAVSISEASRLAQDVQRQLASFPEVDADKVAALKQQIQSGSYEVDSSRLAAKIMMLENMIGDSTDE